MPRKRINGDFMPGRRAAMRVAASVVIIAALTVSAIAEGVSVRSAGIGRL